MDECREVHDGEMSLQHVEDGPRRREAAAGFSGTTAVKPWCSICVKMSKYQKRTAILMLFLVVIVLYAPALSGPFIWDDKPLIVNNPLIKDWSYFFKAFESELHLNTSTNYYRPLQTISFMVDYGIFKLDPIGYHWINVLLHLAVGVLLFFLLKQLTQEFFLSLVSSFLFLIHPIHTEAVSYISGRAELLVAVFILASLLCYIKSQTKDDLQKSSKAFDSQTLVFFVLALLFAILSLLSKETAIVLPLAVLGLDVFLFNERSRTVRVLPFWIIVLIYLLLRVSFLNFAVADPLLSKKGFALLEIDLPARIGIFFKTLVIYLGSLFVPIHLHMERIIETEPIYIFHGLGLSLCVALYLFAFRIVPRFQKNRQLLVFSVYWFFIWLLPQSAFVLPNVMADHFLYLPSMSVFLLMAICLERVESLTNKSLSVAALVIYFGAFTWFYNHQWCSELSFFRRTARFSPMSHKVHDCLADIYLKTNQPEQAIREYMLIIDPKRNIVDAGDFIRFTREVMASPILQKRTQLVSIAFYNIGVIFAELGKNEEAITAYESAIDIYPRSPLAYSNLGLMYEREGMQAKAEELYLKAIELDEKNVQAYNNLAELYAERGELTRAVGLWEMALQIKADYEIAKKNLDLVQEVIGNERK